MKNLDDNTPLAMLTVADLKKLLSIDKIIAKFSSIRTHTSEIMNIDEVVKLTGYSKNTIYKLTHERKIPFNKPAHGGRMLCFNRAEITDWMQARKIQTTEQYCENAINNFHKK